MGRFSTDPTNIIPVARAAQSQPQETKKKKKSLNKYVEKSLKSIHVEVITSGSDMHLTSHLLFVHISILIFIQFLICVDGLYYRMWIMV